MPGSGKRVVQVVLVGDSSSLDRTLDSTARKTDDVAGKAEHAGSRIHLSGERGSEGFETLIRTMNVAGLNLGPLGEAFDHFQNLLSNVEQHASGIQKAIVGTAAAGVALAGVAIAIGGKEQQALAGLQAAVEATGRQWDPYSEAVDAAVTSQEHFGHTANDTVAALAKLTIASQDPQRALRDLHLVTEVAAADHSSLTDAAGKLASAYAGNFRVFRQFGINVKDMADPQKELANATRDHTAAVNEQASAVEHLNDVESRVAAAEQAAQEKKAAAEESAKSAAESADQTLADRRQSIAERIASTEQQAADRVASAREQVASATQHLDDVEAELADRRKLSSSDVASMRDAEMALARVRADIATGRLKGVDASRAQEDAQNRVLDLQRAEAERAQLSVSDQVRLREAHEGVAGAHDNLTDAQRKQADAAKMTTAEQVELRKAIEAVAAAQAKVIEAQRMSTGISLGLLQEERRAREDVAKANGKIVASNAAIAKANRDQAELGARIEQAFAEAEQRLGGTAKAMADTWLGQFHAFLAKMDDEFGAFGQKYGTTVLGLSVLTTALGGPLGKLVGYLRGIGAAGDVAAAGEGAATAAAGVGVGAFAAVATAALAVVADIVLTWQHWDQIWGWIKDHPAYAIVIAVLAGPLAAISAVTGGVKELWQNWDEVWSAIVGKIDWAGNEISHAMSFIGDVVHAPGNFLGGAAGFIGGALPHFAKGGVAQGWSIVGEEGPEAVYFGSPAMVVPTAQTMAGLAAATSSGDTIIENHYHLHAPATDRRSLETLARLLQPFHQQQLVVNSRRGNALPVRT